MLVPKSTFWWFSFSQDNRCWSPKAQFLVIFRIFLGTIASEEKVWRKLKFEDWFGGGWRWVWLHFFFQLKIKAIERLVFKQQIFILVFISFGQCVFTIHDIHNSVDLSWAAPRIWHSSNLAGVQFWAQPTRQPAIKSDQSLINPRPLANNAYLNLYLYLNRNNQLVGDEFEFEQKC